MLKLGITASAGGEEVNPFEGLTMYYKMDADLDANNDIPDATGNGYMGNIVNNTTYNASGIINGTYFFDGGLDFVATDNDSNLVPGTGDYSISVWTYNTETGSGDYDVYDPVIATRVIDGGNTSGGFAMGLYNYGGADQMSMAWGDGSNTVTQYYSTGVDGGIRNGWHHIVAVRDTTAGQVKLYVDGTLRDTDTDTTGNISSFQENLKIGTTLDGSNRYYKGYIDEVGIWKGTALTQDDVTALYNSGSGLQPTTMVTDNIVGYWGFDTSGSVQDYVSKTYNGTVYGATFTSSGKLNGCYSFDGVNDYISCGNGAGLQITGDISVVAWVESGSQGADDNIVTKYQGGVSNNRAWLIGASANNANKIWVAISDDGTSSADHFKLYETTNEVLTSGWQQVGFTFDASESDLKIYVDGVEITAITKTSDGGITSIYNSTENVVIGGYDHTGSLGWTGKIDEVGIWDDVLTPAEVAQLYNNGNGVSY